jgi:hypothetical protein
MFLKGHYAHAIMVTEVTLNVVSALCSYYYPVFVFYLGKNSYTKLSSHITRASEPIKRRIIRVYWLYHFPRKRSES